VLELLDDDLRTAEVAEDLSSDLHLGERLRVGGDLVTVNKQHSSQLDVAVLVGLDAVHRNDGADLDLFLPTTGAHNCVNHFYVPFLWGSAPALRKAAAAVPTFSSGSHW